MAIEGKYLKKEQPRGWSAPVAKNQLLHTTYLSTGALREGTISTIDNGGVVHPSNKLVWVGHKARYSL
jgi:hypothetical protein